MIAKYFYPILKGFLRPPFIKISIPFHLVLALSVFLTFNNLALGQTQKANYENEVLRIFVPSVSNSGSLSEIRKVCKRFNLLDVDNIRINKLLADKPVNFRLELPCPDGKVIVNLGQSLVLNDNAIFTEQGINGVKPFAYRPGLYYQGSMEGDSSSHISISFFENGQVIGLAWSAKPGGNLVIGRLKPANGNWQNSPIVVYDDANLTIKNPFVCGTPDDKPLMQANLQKSNPAPNQTAATCKVISNYWEAGLTLYNQFGNTTSTTNYLTGLFNIVNNLYNVEQLNHKLNRIQVNSASDATDLTSQNTTLSSFGTRISSSLTENLAHYFTGNYSNFGGLAYVGVLCYGVKQYRTGTSNLYATNSALPTYSWDAEVATHEMGHNCGSNHTQWCGWDKGNGVIGQIDSCYASESATGSTQCYTGPNIPRVGTIMSYCHLNGSIDFINGFGPLPGAKIRSDFNSATCLSGATPPSVAISGPTSVCTGENLTLSVSAVSGATYSWSGPGSFTSTGNSITRTGFSSAMAGNYVVVITVNGCSYTSYPKTVSAGDLVTLLSPVSGTGICQGDNLPLSFNFNCNATATTTCQVQISDAFGSWASPVILGTFTQPTSVNTVLTGTSTLSAGNYRLRIVTTHLGLSSTTYYPLGLGINAKTATPPNVSSTICSGNSTTLTAPAIGGGQNANTWYDENNNLLGHNQTFTTPTLSTSTTYKLVQKDSINVAFGKTTVNNGSQRATAGNVGTWFRVYNTLTIKGYTINAAGSGSGSIAVVDSITGNTVGSASFSIPATGNNVISNINLQIAPGIYKLTASATVNLYRGNVTNGQGYPYRIAGLCEMLGADDGNTGHFSTSFYYWFYNLQLGYRKCFSDVGTYTVNISSQPTPTISASGPTTFCSGGSVTLTASSGNSYLWSNGATSQNITVSSAGTYSVKVTNVDGCFATSLATSVSLQSAPSAPTIAASGPSTFCSGGSVTLTASGGTSYLWSDGSTNANLTTGNAGSYSVQAISNGCTSAASSATVVTVNAIPTVPAVSVSGPTTICSGGLVTLTASGGTSYLWNDGSTNSSLTTGNAGSYSVQAISNGCTSAASSATVVSVNQVPVAQVSVLGSTTFCEGDSLILTASGGNTYLWTDNSTDAIKVVKSTGQYSVQTFLNGCQSSVTVPINVIVNPLPSQPSITASGPLTFASTDSVILTASAGSQWLWNTGQTNQSITVKQSGSYSVQLINNNNCTSAISMATVVKVLEKLEVSGTIRTTTGTPISGATVATSLGNDTLTGLSGHYGFYFAPGANFTLHASKANDTALYNGVTTYDCLLIKRHLLGLAPFTSPYTILAANVSNDNRVSTLDIVLVRDFILGNRNNFFGRLWGFVPENYIFNNSSNPFPFDSAIYYTNLAANQTDQNFVAMRLGDVNDSWNPALGRLQVGRFVGLNLPSLQAQAGSEVLVPITTANFTDVASLQFTLGWDASKADFDSLIPGAVSDVFFGKKAISQGKLSLSWLESNANGKTFPDGTVLFYLKLKVKPSATTQIDVSLGSSLIAAEAASGSAQLLGLQPATGQILLGPSGMISSKNGMDAQIFPNPFNSGFSVRFIKPLADNQMLTLHDELGRQVYSQNLELGKDLAEINDEKLSALPAGIYWVQLKSSSAVSQFKLVKK